MNLNCEEEINANNLSRFIYQTNEKEKKNNDVICQHSEKLCPV